MSVPVHPPPRVTQRARPDLSCVRSWPSEEAEEWTREAVRLLRGGPRAEALLAVGSAVRSPGTVADLDLIVLYRDRKPELPPPPLDVDLRFYERQQVEELLEAGHELLGWAVRYGCPVFERGGLWSALRKRWRSRLPLPSQDRARRLASQARAHYQHLSEVGDEDAAREQLLTAVTHQARARLVEAAVYPASRPELPGQLRGIGERELADQLEKLLVERRQAA